jgi:RecA-family ATPase
MLTPYERAKAYAAKVPGAVSGQGGHSTTYDLARVLVHDFALSRDEAMRIFADWNSTCQPPWSQRELEHKLTQAESKPHQTARGSKVRDSAHEVISATGRFVINRSAGVSIGAPSMLNPATSTVDFLRAAFLPGETISICTQAIEGEDGKHRPGSHGTFKPVDWFISQIEAGENPFTCDTDSGRWIRVNPYREDSTTGADSNVSVFRHVLVEFDDLPESEQLHILKASNLPLTAIVSSGGRSYHGWVRVDAPDRKTWDARRDLIYTYLEDAKPCPANKNPGRFSRLPGCRRGEQWQRLISLRCGPETWEEFETWMRRRDLPQAMNLVEVQRVPINPDPTCILGNRWLCKGGSLTIVSSSGIGKSSFVLQFATALATAVPFFGIRHPAQKPMKVGLIQAENDWGDVREAMEGALYWLCSSQHGHTTILGLLNDNIRFFRENTKTGEVFLNILRQLIKEHALEVVVVDPLMAYFGGDVADQKSMSVFLRNTLQPILDETGCVVILVHHTAKPKNDAKTTATDIAYLGAGSSELTNWSREIAVLQREPDRKDGEQGAFTLTLCKRGRRAGLVDMKGNVTNRVRLDHAREHVFWTYAEPIELNEEEEEKPRIKSRPPKRTARLDD